MKREEFEKAYAKRSNLTWASSPNSLEAKIAAWSSKVIVLAISAEYGDFIESQFDQVEFRHGYVPPQFGGFPTESIAGYCRGIPLTIMHVGITPGAHGGPYMDMALERLRSGPVKEVILVGECTSLQSDVRIGDVLIPVTTIRNDDIHHSYFPTEIPATADDSLSHSLWKAAEITGFRTHMGVGWSCSAGAGIFDPELLGMAYTYHQMGVLGNAVEASCAYLLGKLMGVRVSSIWLVADSLFETLPWDCPSPRCQWGHGWDRLVQVALDALISIEEAESGP